MEPILDALKPVLEGLAGGWGVAVQVLLVVGVLRVVVKPVMAIAQSVVSLTPSQKDDELVQKILDSKVYKALVFTLDWLASIKLPKK